MVICMVATIITEAEPVIASVDVNRPLIMDAWRFRHPHTNIMHTLYKDQALPTHQRLIQARTLPIYHAKMHILVSRYTLRNSTTNLRPIPKYPTINAPYSYTLSWTRQMRVQPSSDDADN